MNLQSSCLLFFLEDNRNVHPSLCFLPGGITALGEMKNIGFVLAQRENLVLILFMNLCAVLYPLDLV